ncbi:hypothetical protein MVEG_07513 [Podila verticillata NRRL 6337]|nr:hypothetical protein MVEG_07513 [Podila verticillata NRRL 6337]
MELDESPASAPTSRLDHLAELATSPTHAHPSVSSSSSSSSFSSFAASNNSNNNNTSSSPEKEHPFAHKHSHSHSHSESLMNESSSSHSRSHILESESSSNWKSPITPTTTRKFNRMAIHGVLEGTPNHPPHPLDDGSRSPPYKRKGSPDESFSDPPSSRSHPGSSFAASGAALRGSYDRPSSSHHSHSQSQGRYQQPHHQTPHSPRYRQESPMPASNSEDEEDDLRYKKRRLASSSSSKSQNPHPHHLAQVTPPSPALNPNGGSEVMDQVRTTLKLKQQQKAIIESRQHASTPTTTSPPTSQTKSSSSSPSSQPVTEKNPSGISVFHGSASFAAMNRRPLPLTSPKNPKNAKSLTIFAPSYSESSLSIQSAPLQPSHGHGRPLHSQLPHALNHHPMSSMNPRTSQPLGHHKPHPFSQGQATPRSPTKLAGHAKKASRGLLRQPNHDHSSSGTLPAPILSSHTGPLPSPMYPPPHHAHPSTPFLPHHHASSTSSSSKHVFMETISGLYDSVDSTKSLKYTLEEQIRKSAQLLQTLQASGTMIESLVRGQFKELEKGVIERFENELEHLAVRVKALEEHQGLTTPPVPKKAPRAQAPSSSAMTGVTSTAAASGSSSSPTKVGNNGTLPTPPLSKTQEEELSSSTASPMEVEDDESTTPPREKAHSTEYHSSVKKLQERVADLEKKNSRPISEAPSRPTTVVASS